MLRFLSWCFLGLASSAWAQSPQLSVQAQTWKDGALTVSVSVYGPASGERLTIGSPATPWQKALTLKVIDGDGLEQRWPFTTEDSASATSSIPLTKDHGGGRTFRLTAAQVAALKAGACEVVATLDLTAAPSGFKGAVTATTSVTMGTPPLPPDSTVSSVNALAELRAALPNIGTRNGLMRVEGLLLDAPELPEGPALDAVVTAHLKALAERMRRGTGYARDEDSYQPRRDLVLARSVQLTPARVSTGFTLKLGAVTLVRAASLEAFWASIPFGGTGAGVHVLSVRALGDVVRVATVPIDRDGHVALRVEVSFWKGAGTSWKELSFVPWSNDARELWSNVYPGGQAKQRPEQLTLVERKQYLELRLGVAEVARNADNDVSLTRGFGAGEVDASYLPLLQATLKRRPSPRGRNAVVGAMMALGQQPSEAVAMELLADESFEGEPRYALVRSYDAKLSGGRPATDAEFEAIVGHPPVGPRRASPSPQPGPPSFAGPSRRLEGLGPQTDVSIIDEQYAVVVEDNMSRGQKTLFRKVDGAWKRVTGLQFWVH